MTTPKLLGLAEIAEKYGVSKNSANAWTRRHDFPAPMALLKMGPVWDDSAVTAWRRPGGGGSVSVSTENRVLTATVPQPQCFSCDSFETMPDEGSLVVYASICEVVCAEFTFHCSTCKTGPTSVSVDLKEAK